MFEPRRHWRKPTVMMVQSRKGPPPRQQQTRMLARSRRAPLRWPLAQPRMKALIHLCLTSLRRLKRPRKLLLPPPEEEAEVVVAFEAVEVPAAFEEVEVADVLEAAEVPLLEAADDGCAAARVARAAPDGHASADATNLHRCRRPELAWNNHVI